MVGTNPFDHWFGSCLANFLSGDNIEGDLQRCERPVECLYGYKQGQEEDKTEYSHVVLDQIPGTD